jgi:hypothetical protein
MQGFEMLGMLLGDHLPLGKISDHHRAFNQSVSDEMGGFVQTVTALVALLFGDPPVDLRKMNVPARFLFAVISLGADLVEVLVVPLMPLEAPMR